MLGTKPGALDAQIPGLGTTEPPTSPFVVWKLSLHFA